MVKPNWLTRIKLSSKGPSFLKSNMRISHSLRFIWFSWANIQYMVVSFKRKKQNCKEKNGFYVNKTNFYTSARRNSQHRVLLSVYLLNACSTIYHVICFNEISKLWLHGSSYISICIIQELLCRMDLNTSGHVVL